MNLALDLCLLIPPRSENCRRDIFGANIGLAQVLLIHSTSLAASVDLGSRAKTRRGGPLSLRHEGKASGELRQLAASCSCCSHIHCNLAESLGVCRIRPLVSPDR